MSDLGGFVLTGNALDAAQGMLSLAGGGNDFHPTYTPSEMAMMRTYFLEFDTMSGMGRMPNCFLKDYGGYIEDYVMLRDPMNNEIEVRLYRRGDKLYMRKGWYGLKDFYNIELGAWIDLTYERPNLMTLTINNRFFEEILYPAHTTPIISKLDRRDFGGNLDDFFETFTIELTYSDVNSGCLTLPWFGFCKRVLPPINTDLTVIDYVGFAWRCDLKFIQRDKTPMCTIEGDWGTICKARRFVEGRSIDLAVTEEKNNYVLYLKFIPVPSTNADLIRGIDPRFILQSDASIFCFQDSANDLDPVRRDLSRLRTYRLELDSDIQLKARLPSCFAKEVGVHIDDHVMLRDPNNNIIVVEVQKKNGKVYFRQGWSRVKDIYNIVDGAWVYLKYAGPNLLLMTIRNKAGLEIPYPLSDISLALPRFITSSGESQLVHFFRTSVKILTSSDVLSGTLTLPWYGFCQKSLPQKPTTLTIVGPNGCTWRCDLTFAVANNMPYAMIGGDWNLICTSQRLVAGHAVKFAVVHDKDNTVLGFRHTPIHCTHGYYVKPMVSGSGRYVYQVNHYLKYCKAKSMLEQMSG